MRSNRVLLFALLLSVFMTTGCVGVVASLTASATQAALMNLEFENVEVKANVAPYITPEQLEDIRYVAVMLRERRTSNDQSVRLTGMVSALQGQGNEDTMSIFADTFSMELMTLGYKVMERDQLSMIMSEKGLEASGVAESDTSKLSAIKGVDALVILNAQTSNKTKYKAFGGARFESVVQTATARIVNVHNGELIMTVNLDYKNGQEANIAAQTMAQALKAKLHGEEIQTAKK